MKILATCFLLLAAVWTASAATRNNDDSCDIVVAPAATLLLPYFEIDLDDPNGETTIFTITNVTNVDRIARVTLWTDYAYPVVTFNVFLTGYDVQSINLYDIIAHGIIAPEEGTGTHVSRRGPYSERNLSLDFRACGQLPGQLVDAYIIRMQRAFTEGTVPSFGDDPQGCYNVGGEHDNAVGYATIDLVRNCSTNNPFAHEYWSEDLAYDNVLIGDHQQVHSNNDFAQGSPMVHIRAIPEGGMAAQRLEYERTHTSSGFPRTFYGLYQPSSAPKLDRRQPLPSVFTARWISGGASGFETELKIWREGTTGRDVSCATHFDNFTYLSEIVRFDEAENPIGGVRPRCGFCPPLTTDFMLPASSMTNVGDGSIFPQLSNGAVGGWLYLNLDNSQFDDKSSSNWVISSMRAEGRYSVAVEAAPLGNGCSAPRRSPKSRKAPRSSDHDHENTSSICSRSFLCGDRFSGQHEQQRQLRHRPAARGNTAPALLRSRRRRSGRQHHVVHGHERDARRPDRVRDLMD